MGAVGRASVLVRLGDKQKWSLIQSGVDQKKSVYVCGGYYFGVLWRESTIRRSGNWSFLTMVMSKFQFWAWNNALYVRLGTFRGI